MAKKNDLQNQDRHWSRHAAQYGELFVDPFGPEVENPLWKALAAIPDAQTKTVADLGCGTGPLLPYLTSTFDRVIALDFAPEMLRKAADRLDPRAAARVTFLERPMHKLDDLAGQLDVAVAINSLVMPDVRVIDRTLRSIRASLKPGGQFLGVVPSIDTIAYQLMLFLDQSLDQGLEPTKPRGSRPSCRAPFLRFRVRGISLRRTAAEVLAAVRARISSDQGRISGPRVDEGLLSLGRSRSRGPLTGRLPAQLGLVFFRMTETGQTCRRQRSKIGNGPGLDRARSIASRDD